MSQRRSMWTTTRIWVMVVGCLLASIGLWASGPLYDFMGWAFVAVLSILMLVEDIVGDRLAAAEKAEAVSRGARFEAGLAERERLAYWAAREEEAMLWWETLAGVDAVAPLPHAVAKWHIGLYDLALGEGRRQGLGEAADRLRAARRGPRPSKSIIDEVAAELDIHAGREEKQH